MKLIDYLNSHDLTASAFAGLIGRSPATVSRIVRGLNPPDWDTMQSIATATDGAVMPNDFLPETPAERREAC